MPADLNEPSEHPAFAEPLTKEEWRDYVASESPAPPELPSPAAYGRLSGSAREDLEERRYDYHSALILVQTPAMLELHRSMRTTVRMNRVAPAGARRGHVVDGDPTLGKSTIIKTFGRDYERHLRRRHPQRFNGLGPDFTPVVYISVPSGATPRGLSLRFAEYLGLPTKVKVTADEATNQVFKALRECGTRIVLIDDIHFLDCSQKEGKLANDHLKYLANYCAATFIYAGVDIASTSLFSEGSGTRKTQTAGRFSVLPVRPFGQQLLHPPGKPNSQAVAAARREREEWVKVVLSLDDALRLFNHKPGMLAKHWEYLLERTGGSIAALSGLVRTAAIMAIEDGSEKITRSMLDGIETDWTSQRGFEQRRKSGAKLWAADSEQLAS